MCIGIVTVTAAVAEDEWCMMFRLRALRHGELVESIIPRNDPLMFESKNRSFAFRNVTVIALGKLFSQRPYRQFPGLRYSGRKD